MNKDVITVNEVQKTARPSICTSTPEVGLYVAYGFSAFYAAHIVNVIASFSEDMQMPVALLKKPDVTELRLSTNKLQHDYHVYYKLALKHELGLDDYGRWVESVK